MELISSIYVKALKRVDVSGVTNTTEENRPADVGKVVNLMSSDVNTVSFLEMLCS